MVLVKKNDTFLRILVLDCKYCILENIVDHSITSPLQMMESEDPFYVIFMGVWSPG